MDGVTASTAELNLRDGVTASTAELNILDGLTASTVELNYVAGVTSALQPQLDALTAGKEPANADILKADESDDLTVGYTDTPHGTVITNGVDRPVIVKPSPLGDAAESSSTNHQCIRSFGFAAPDAPAPPHLIPPNTPTPTATTPTV